MELPPVLTVREAAKVMRVGQNVMYGIVRRKGFPVIREGWKFLIPRDAFLRWIEEQAYQSRNNVENESAYQPHRHR